ncbi:unnamed protein product [Rotaria socialis]|uniref:Uncharacterized protein n=1 Tax=Rotaria socialis TaxID=392032 RepID=A0A817V5C3_9BILA|nr:unnamed protein product [Rotaria socialis]
MQEKTTRTDEETCVLKHFYDEDLYNDLDEKEVDNTTLRYTLLQCRRQLLMWVKVLTETDYAYARVELRDDFDKLKVETDNLKIATVLLNANFQELLDNCKCLIDQTTEILIDRNNYYSEWESNRNILTPRPDWDKCFRMVPNWKMLSIDKTSEQLVDILINEIVHGNTTQNNNEYFSMMTRDKNELHEKNMFFKQLCMNPCIEEKFIKNRHMRRRITGLLIKDIWSSKLFNENHSENKANIKLTDYVFDYLTKKFCSKEIAIEIGYNIKDACNRYRNSYEINLFWQILTGQIEENVYHYEMKEFARILQHLIKLSPNFSSQSVFKALKYNFKSLHVTFSFERLFLFFELFDRFQLISTIRWLDLASALRELYPHWTNERISLLITSAERDLKKSTIDNNELQFLLLFTVDDEGHLGEFLINIRQQLKLDKIEYIEKITDLLIGYPLISMNHFKQAVQFVDPHISEKELQRYANWVFELDNISAMLNSEGISAQTNKTIESIKKIQSRDFEEIILRLERCSCFMH